MEMAVHSSSPPYLAAAFNLFSKLWCPGLAKENEDCASLQGRTGPEDKSSHSRVKEGGSEFRVEKHLKRLGSGRSYGSHEEKLLRRRSDGGPVMSKATGNSPRQNRSVAALAVMAVCEPLSCGI
ncbi:hypothetical protein AOLI_G00142310 [Acnodon oligacanthus]